MLRAILIVMRKRCCPNEAENDVDGDRNCGDADSCPYGRENDLDSNGICDSADTCPMICPRIIIVAMKIHALATNSMIATRTVNRWVRQMADVDPCPFDAENDADSDNICGDVHTCAYVKNNDNRIRRMARTRIQCAVT